MKNRTNSISGLDLQKEYLSVAQYFPNENSVALVAIQPIADGKTSDLWERIAVELKELKSKFRFSSPDIVCSLPSEYSVVKRIGLDDSEENPQESIEWELGQQIIGAIEEYAFDFQESRHLPNEHLREYIVVAYKNEIVQKIASVTRGLKLNPLVVDIDAFALINVFEANYQEYLNVPSIIVHAESELSKLILTQNGNFLDYSTFEYDFTTLDAPIYSDRLHSEISRFLSVNGTVGPDYPISIYLTGSLFSQAVFAQTIIQDLGNAEILFPFRKIGCHVGIDDEQLRTYSSQLAVAVGLALRGNE